MGTETTKTAVATSTPSPLDEAQKNRDNAFTQWQAAVDEANRKEQERLAQPDAPGTSYEDFLKGAMPEQPTTQIDPKKEKARAWITNIADAINAVGGIVGAATGADVVPATSLSAANQQRYNTLVERRDKEREAYNRGVMQAQSHAMSMAEAYRRKRQQEDAQASALDQAKINRAKMEYQKADDDYNQIYKQHRDSVTDNKTERAEQRADDRLERQISESTRQQNNTNRREIRLHNDAERRLYENAAIGEYYPRRGQTEALYADVFEKIKNDNAVKSDIKKELDTIKAYEDGGMTDKANAIKSSIIKRYLADPTTDVYKKVMNAVSESPYAGKPDVWPDDYFDDNTREGIDIPGITPGR